jgi:diguanylate cyclase (GGDEF)-like protein
MVDLDEFKKLNDRYGHVVGDQALRATAEVLSKTLRKTDMICRYGGEEFLVVLPETEPEQAAVLAARLFTAVEACGLELELPITVSIGMSAMQSGDGVEQIVNRADQALYASKSQGRNRFSVNVEAGQGDS